MKSEATGRERLDQIEKLLLELHRREGTDGDDQDILLEAAMIVSWDDAIHIAAPWEPRSSLCGNWFRNLVTLDDATFGDQRPNGFEGCWTCLMAADWFDEWLGDWVEQRFAPRPTLLSRISRYLPTQRHTHRP